MGGESLFYRPRNRLISTIEAYLGGPSPSRKDDPAVRFGPDGVEYHDAYKRGSITRLGWQDVRAVAFFPGPIEDRYALCVYPLHELPEPEMTRDQASSGAAPGLQSWFRQLFGTPLTVHWHHVRGPSLSRLAARLPDWTEGRIALLWERPA